MFYTIRSDKTAAKNTDNDNEKLIAIIEIVILVFLTTFIPSLIKLGRPPANLGEIYVELLVALLASLWAYMRIRGINLGGSKK